MKLLTTAIVGTLLIAGTVFGADELASVELKPGDPAPQFVMPGSDGKDYKLADYRAKKIVVLAWYPKAFTGG